MQYQHAYNSVIGWVGSDLARDIDDAQFDKLVRKLTYTVKDLGIVISPEAVNVHAEHLFPELFENEGESMQHTRVVPPRERPKQTREQAIAVITDFLNKSWSLVAPGCLLPTVSKTNHALFFDAVNAWAKQGGLIRADHLAGIAANLFQRGALEKPAAPPEVVPPPAPPSPQELAREQAKKVAAFERSLNDRDTSPLRGAREKAQPLIAEHKPVLTEEQKQAANDKAARENAIVNEALSRISTFTGASHSRTYSGRAALRSVFQEQMDLGKSAEEVLAAVEAKADQLAGNPSVR